MSVKPCVNRPVSSNELALAALPSMHEGASSQVLTRRTTTPKTTNHLVRH
jgi:hypothetical protein